MKTLSIIVPTPDGGNLPALHASLEGKLYPGDEVIVVGDTFHDHPNLPAVAQAVENVGWRWLEHNAGYMGWGHPQINYGITQARGDYLVFQDDDDVFAPDAMVNIHRAIRNVDPPRPHLFRFKAARFGGQVFWIQKGLVQEGTIGGHCLVTPNDPDRTAEWTDRYAGDFDFVKGTLDLWHPVEPIWRQEVITFAR